MRKTGQRVYLEFVGCRLNEAEIERMARQFAARGDAIVHDAAQANVVVINTCAVTNEATRKSRQRLYQAARANSQARIVATGLLCAACPGQSRSHAGRRCRWSGTSTKTGSWH